MSSLEDLSLLRPDREELGLAAVAVGDGVVAGPAGGAVAVGRAAHRGEHPFEGEVGEAVRIDFLDGRSSPSSKNFAEPVVKSCPFSLSMLADMMDQRLNRGIHLLEASEKLLQGIRGKNQVLTRNSHPLAPVLPAVLLEPSVLSGPIDIAHIELSDDRVEDLPEPRSRRQ